MPKTIAIISALLSPLPAVSITGSAALAVNATESEYIEKVPMGNKGMIMQIHWNKEGDIKQMSVVDAKHEIPEFYTPSIALDDGTRVQGVDFPKTGTFIQYDKGTQVKLYHKNRILIKREQFNVNGVMVGYNEYINQVMRKAFVDEDEDGVFDEITTFDENGNIVKVELDFNNDGVIDKVMLPGKDF